MNRGSIFLSDISRHIFGDVGRDCHPVTIKNFNHIRNIQRDIMNITIASSAGLAARKALITSGVAENTVFVGIGDFLILAVSFSMTLQSALAVEGHASRVHHDLSIRRASMPHLRHGALKALPMTVSKRLGRNDGTSP